MTVSNQAISPVSSSSQTDAAEFAAAFARLEPEIREVPDSKLVTINIDVPISVTTVLGSLPELRALRGELAELTGFDLVQFDKLRDYALALLHAHALYRAAGGPTDGRIAELADKVTSVRDLLQADAAGLAKRGILDEGQLARSRGGVGYRNAAVEVAGLVALFRERWDRIQGRTPLTLAELEQAGKLAQELIIAVGVKEQGPAAVSAASLLRQRAFSLFVHSYDQARRGVAYLRWDRNDADSIAPSLYLGRGGRKAPAQEEPTEVQAADPAESS